MADNNETIDQLYYKLGQVTFQLEIYSAMIKNLEDKKNQLLHDINNSEYNLENSQENDKANKQQ